MIEIAKGLISMIVTTINTLFNIPIQLSNTLTVKLGFIAIGVVLLSLALLFFFSILNIGGDD